jgi:hypothetical protein
VVALPELLEGLVIVLQCAAQEKVFVGGRHRRIPNLTERTPGAAKASLNRQRGGTSTRAVQFRLLAIRARRT